MNIYVPEGYALLRIIPLFNIIIFFSSALDLDSRLCMLQTLRLSIINIDPKNFKKRPKKLKMQINKITFLMFNTCLLFNLIKKVPHYQKEKFFFSVSNKLSCCYAHRLKLSNDSLTRISQVYI